MNSKERVDQYKSTTIVISYDDPTRNSTGLLDLESLI